MNEDKLYLPSFRSTQQFIHHKKVLNFFSHSTKLEKTFFIYKNYFQEQKITLPPSTLKLFFPLHCQCLILKIFFGAMSCLGLPWKLDFFWCRDSDKFNFLFDFLFYDFEAFNIRVYQKSVNHPFQIQKYLTNNTKFNTKSSTKKKSSLSNIKSIMEIRSKAFLFNDAFSIIICN